MRKIWAIARREYLAAVQSKAFIITILLMPVLMGGSIGIQVLFRQLDEGKKKEYVVIDHTPGGALGKYLAETAEASIDRGLLPKGTVFKLEAPRADIEMQRAEIAREIEEKNTYEALLEIGANVKASQAGLTPNKSDLADADLVRLESKGLGGLQLRYALQGILTQAVLGQRFADKGLNPADAAALFAPVLVRAESLTRLDAEGKPVRGGIDRRILNLVLPGIVIAVMFMVVFVGATPAMHGVIEEKSQRIAEVLLASVTPFQLMAGKLLGIVGVALTMAVVYLGGGYFLAWYFGQTGEVPLRVLLWFVPMLILALLTFGSLFIAVGAAATDIKDTQTLLMPVMLIACLPFFALGPIIQQPDGPIARACTFFPFATPMLLVARQTAGVEMPVWEVALAVAIALATAFICLWAASRIFRVGLLLHGKTPSFGELFRWVVKG